MEEIWKPVTGYVSLYEVSSLGRVRSCRLDKILRPHTNSQGLAKCILFSDKDGRPDGKNYGKCHSVHRMMWQAFFGPIPHGMEVAHIKNSRRNVIGNLELISSSESWNRAWARALAGRRKRKAKARAA